MPFRRRVRLVRPDAKQSGEPRTLYWVGIILVFIFALSLVFELAGKHNFVGSGIIAVTSVFVSGARYVGEGFSSLGLIFRLKPILQENITLESENASLRKQLGEYEATKAENDRLRKLLKLPEKSKYDYVSAKIIGRSLELWFDSVWINRGTRAGVQIGDLVVNIDGLVGEVITAEGARSQVRLILNPDFAIGAITAVSRQQGVVAGGKRGKTAYVNTVDFSFVAKKNRISVGEKVFTSGLATGRPGGIYIGQVTKVIEEPNRITQTIEVTPAVDLNSIEEVVVILHRPAQAEIFPVVTP